MQLHYCCNAAKAVSSELQEFSSLILLKGMYQSVSSQRICELRDYCTSDIPIIYPWSMQETDIGFLVFFPIKREQLSSDDLSRVTEQVSGKKLCLLIPARQDALSIASQFCSLDDHREDGSRLFAAEIFSGWDPLTCRGLIEPSALRRPMRGSSLVN